MQRVTMTVHHGTNRGTEVGEGRTVVDALMALSARNSYAASAPNWGPVAQALAAVGTTQHGWCTYTLEAVSDVTAETAAEAEVREVVETALYRVSDGATATGYAAAVVEALRESYPGAFAPYVLHYASADMPGEDSTWSVYSEHYVSASANEPIDGTQRHVSQHASEAEAYAEVERLQALANR